MKRSAGVYINRFMGSFISSFIEFYKKKKLISFSSFIFLLLLVGFWPFNFWQSNKAHQSPSNGLSLTPPAISYTPVPPDKLLSIKEFTILLNLSSDFSGSKGYARILSYSDGENINFMVGQWRNSLVFKLRADDIPKLIHFETDDIFEKDKKQWIAIVFDGKNLSLYQDGNRKNGRTTGSLKFSNWVRSCLLVIGSDANGEFFWKGNIYSVAMFGQAFSQKGIQSLPIYIGNFHPLIHYSFEDGQGTTVIDLGKGQPANLAIPQHFIPYKRIVLEKPYSKLCEYRHNLMDIAINIVGFVPLGFLLSVYLPSKRLPFITALLLSGAVGFSVSLAIEILQAFLPGRASSMTDLIANTFGTSVGFLAFTARAECGIEDIHQ